MPSWIGLCLQDLRSPFLQIISNLHDHAIVVMFIVIFLISYIIICLSLNSFFYKFLSEGTFIETIWSMVPAFLLGFLIIPSMSCLYGLEDFKYSHFTFKVVAHQWYWTYIVPFFKNLFFSFGGRKFYYHEYDSIIDSPSLESEFPRLLGCNSLLFIPEGASTRLLVTSSDVIHAFAVPSLGVKVDAVPGRTNQIFIIPSRIGFFFGQCSEICGSNHSFIPIIIKITTYWEYLDVTLEFVYDYLEDNLS